MLIKTTPVLFNIVRYLGAFFICSTWRKILYATLISKGVRRRNGSLLLFSSVL